MNAGARLLNDGSVPAMSLGEPRAARTGGECATCGAGHAAAMPSAASGFVYAIGRIAPQFPDLGVEREFAQLGIGGAGGLEPGRLVDVLKDPSTAYLARQLCWVFSAGDVEAFVLAPRDDAQLRALVESIPRADAMDATVQVVIGTVGPPDPRMACAAAALPTVVVDHHLAFPVGDFVNALAKQGGGGKKGAAERAAPDDAFRGAARDLFARLTRRSDNQGVADEHRAANYVALRYPQLYELAAQASRDDKSLVDVQLRRGGGAGRRLVSVRLSFRARRTDLTERFQCLVDVTDRFPFLASPLAPVYD